MIPVLLDLPGRDEARRAAQHELSRHEYAQARPPWLQRLAAWVVRRLDDLVSRAGHHLPGGAWGLVLLVVLVTLLVAVVLVRVRPRTRRAGLPALFEQGAALTAAQHRELAEQAAARGDHAEAVRERLRAVVRELEVRGGLEARPGRTADEVAAEAGRLLPDLAVPLREGARVFDEVWYGGQDADASSYQVLVRLDERVRAARLVSA